MIQLLPLLFALTATVNAHASRKPGSIRQLILTCKVSQTTEETSKSLILYLDDAGGKPKTLLIDLTDAAPKNAKIDSLQALPRGGFTEAEALTGSSRFLRSLILKVDGVSLEIFTDFDSTLNAYPGRFNEKKLNCTFTGSFHEAIDAIQSTLR